MKRKYLNEKIELFLISALGLFLQMACIRWLPSQVQILAYYTNLVLLAAFLGLGVGYLLVPKKFKFIYTFPFVLAFMMLICFWLSGAEVGHSTNIEFWQTVIKSHFSISLKWLIPLFFILVAFLFIPLGKQTGILFDILEPIPAYSINILGSVCGIIVYSFLSYNLLPPLWLFGIFMTFYLYFIYTRTTKIFFVVSVVLFIAILSWINYNDRGTFWSPYYKIKLLPLNKQSTCNDGFNLTVNNDYHQMALNLSDAKVKIDRGLWQWANLYELPFKLKDNIDDVLIVGAGTGNDVAGAIRQKVKHIDAVDIDPLIMKIGKKHHPELPYSNKNVSVVVDDARSYFKKTHKKYDVIVFGFLDSHQLFSSMSSLRLDTYVYTVESIKEAKKLLKPNGIISLTFCVTKPWIGNRLLQIMKEATGKEPIMISSGQEPNGSTFVYCENDLDLSGMKEYVVESPASVFGTEKIVSSRDDWPFFYLKSKQIPADYLIFIFFIIMISVV
ncbi:methyltransferase domain-containing protein, partial [bacterium]|nr:methyltransferase domain-containing protein [bacterium]